jgi:hypothetical protein
MENIEICEMIKSEIPETRNLPSLMQTFMIHLTELNKLVMKINEHSNDKKISILIDIDLK